MVALSPVEMIPGLLFTATDRSPEAVAALFSEPVGCNSDVFRSRQIIRIPPNTHGAPTRTHTHQDHGQCKATAKMEATIATTARIKVPIICRTATPPMCRRTQRDKQTIQASTTPSPPWLHARRFYPAPLSPSSHRCRFSLGKIISQEWRLRHPKDASAASALDGDLCAVTRCPARGGRPGCSYWRGQAGA
jgi:hypothetical protein